MIPQPPVNDPVAHGRDARPHRTLILIQVAVLVVLVPFPVISAARPVSVSWYIQTPGATEKTQAVTEWLCRVGQ